MISYKDLKHKPNMELVQPEKLGLLHKTLIQTLVLLSNSIPNLKLSFYDKILNFIRVLGIYLLKSNSELNLHGAQAPGLSSKKNENRTIQSLIDFLFQFNILTIEGKRLKYNDTYISLIEDENKTINSLVDSGKPTTETSLRSGHKKLVNDFLFVNDLIKKYRNKNHPLKHITKNKRRWASMLENKTLDYEVRLCETLFQLTRLKIPHKIKSPFDENYYTESGRNAFKNYTQYSFTDFYSGILKKNSISALDIGCGYGNYLSVINDAFPQHLVIGIEKNPKVFSETSDRFKNTENVTVINDDIFNFQTTRKFDAILINYALFYFNKEEKKALLKKAGKLLSAEGSIIICQYFSQIEELKEQLAKMQNEASVAKNIEMFYGNKILYANTLWNDAVDTFSESVKWDEFIEIIASLGLRIEHITNADKFYYSLFIELKNSD